jgi:hypothetical protein
MRKAIVCTILGIFGAVSIAHSQATSVTSGQEFELILPDDGNFEHVDFPRKNFIIKRGGIADMKSVDGNTVVVDRIERKDGQVLAVLRRKDGRKFFRHLREVRAQWPEALNQGEIAR